MSNLIELPLQALARLVTADDLAAGCIYPDVRNLRNISLLVARAVAQKVRGVDADALRIRSLALSMGHTIDCRYLPG